MPELPKLVADIFSALFCRPAKVTKIETIAHRFRRVTFQGERLRGVSFRPGQEIEFRVSDTSFRHYTPLHFDPELGVMQVLFFLHGDGPGSIWVEKLETDQEVNVLGPGGRFGLRKGTNHILLGDESSLGLAINLSSACDELVGIIETAKDCKHWPEDLKVRGLRAVERTGDRGSALVNWIEESLGSRRDPDPVFYLVGHAQSIHRLREQLIGHGYAARKIRRKPYWSDGKRGL